VRANSGVARSLRASGLTRPSAASRAFKPLGRHLAPALGARFASTDPSHGKIHQIIGAVVDGMSSPYEIAVFTATDCPIVKFPTEKLPAILNAIETDNQGNRLVLEVAVCSVLR
jgi:F-type H+-transporting ATPase subunit beta